LRALQLLAVGDNARARFGISAHHTPRFGEFALGGLDLKAAVFDAGLLGIATMVLVRHGYFFLDFPAFLYAMAAA